MPLSKSVEEEIKVLLEVIEQGKMMKISEKLDQLSGEFNSQLEYEREKLNESYVSALICVFFNIMF